MSDGDPWPDEPDDPPNPGDQYLNRFDGEPAESDPEADFSFEVPDDSNVPEGLFREFWGLVATINLGLFAASLGLMLVVFRGQLFQGGAVFLLGVAALAYAVKRYRQVQATEYDEGEGGDGEDGTGGDDEAGAEE